MMVDKLIATNFDLYAKNAVGRNMLDRNNLPYNIGRNVSVVVCPIRFAYRQRFLYLCF